MFFQFWVGECAILSPFEASSPSTEAQDKVLWASSLDFFSHARKCEQSGNFQEVERCERENNTHHSLQNFNNLKTPPRDLFKEICKHPKIKEDKRDP